MYFFNQYYNNIIKYDLVNKFSYKNLKTIPELKKIVLTFNCKNFEIKQLSSALLALKFITNKNGKLTVSKKPNILLKIRKGNPVGCKIILTKLNMYIFMEKLYKEILPKFKHKINIKQNQNLNAITFNISNPLIFKELEKNYFLFNSLKNLQITILFNSINNKELLFLLNSIKIKL